MDASQEGAADGQAATRARPLARLLGAALLGAVLFLTLSDEIARPHFLPAQDKIEHLLAFGGLGFCFGWGASLWAMFGYALALSGAAFGIEWMQESFTRTREAGLADALAGMAGLALGLAGASLASAALDWLMRRGDRRALAQ